MDWYDLKGQVYSYHPFPVMEVRVATDEEFEEFVDYMTDRTWVDDVIHKGHKGG